MNEFSPPVHFPGNSSEQGRDTLLSLAPGRDKERLPFWLLRQRSLLCYTRILEGSVEIKPVQQVYLLREKEIN